MTDLLGHDVHPDILKHLAQAFQEAKARWTAAHPDKPFRSMPRSRPCHRCGRSLEFEWNETDGSIHIGTQVEPNHLWDNGWPKYAPQDDPCPTPEYTPTTVRFTCKSGRVALANDLREHLPTKTVEAGHRFEIGTHAGTAAYIEHYARHGYLTQYVGNTRVWFVPTKDGIDIHYPGWGDDHIGDDGWDQLDKRAAHKVSTELRWVCIIDAEDLPHDAQDSYDRPVGYLDLDPGEYEFTAQPSTSGKSLVATLRKIN